MENNKDIYQVIQYNPFTNDILIDKDIVLKKLQFFGTLVSFFKRNRIHALEGLKKTPIRPTSIKCIKCVKGVRGDTIYVGYGICWFRAFVEVLMSGHIEFKKNEQSGDFPIMIELMKDSFSRNCELFEAELNNGGKFKFNIENYNVYLMYILSEKGNKFRYNVAANFKTLVPAICEEYIDSIHILIKPLKLFSHVYDFSGEKTVTRVLPDPRVVGNRIDPNLYLEIPHYKEEDASTIENKYLLLTYFSKNQRLENPGYELFSRISLGAHRNNLVLYAIFGEVVYELVAVVITNHIKTIGPDKKGHILSIVRGEGEIFKGVEVDDFNIYEQLFLHRGELSINWDVNLQFNLNIGNRDCIYKKVEEASNLVNVKKHISKFLEFENLMRYFNIYRRIPSYKNIFLQHLDSFVSGYGYYINYNTNITCNIFDLLHSFDLIPPNIVVEDKYRDTFFGIIKVLQSLIIKDDEIVENYFNSIQFEPIDKTYSKGFKQLDYCIENLFIINKYKSLFNMLITSENINLKGVEILKDCSAIINAIKNLNIDLSNIELIRFYINVDNLNVCFSFDYLAEAIYKKSIAIIEKNGSNVSPLTFIQNYFDVEVVEIEMGGKENTLKLDDYENKTFVGLYDPVEKNENWVGYFRIRNNLFKSNEKYTSTQTIFDLLLNTKKNGMLYYMYCDYNSVTKDTKDTEAIIKVIPDAYRVIASIISTIKFTTFNFIFNYLIKNGVAFEFYMEDTHETYKITNTYEYENILADTKKLNNIYGFSILEESLEESTLEMKGLCAAIELYMSYNFSEYIENGKIGGGSGSSGKKIKSRKIGIVYKNNTYKPYFCKKKNEIYIIVDNIRKYPKYPFKLTYFGQFRNNNK